ncbi:unnamed protein product [Oppiella nova]|uniref:Protein kinase domain-containing protein n=1 Tax=Oppiella nova TaxID=334625 RepID=A0A7R9QJF7_9ACAR|nr:unnamed protein product [Oppiella nova]CAG2166211.1 unnamed protein product [Oppiella nova]
MFIEKLMIGEGSYGNVFKAKHKYTDEIYAIKQIDLDKDKGIEENKQIFNEIKSLSRVSSPYVVKYYDFWLDENYFYIQMECLSENLQYFIDTKPQIFDRQSREPMDCVEYFISCEIFREILESVQYLHELNPQIIHRDLKPHNILIDRNGRNGRFVKLCDFGLAVVHQKSIHLLTSKRHTSGVGTLGYIAPEVLMIIHRDLKPENILIDRIGQNGRFVKLCDFVWQ